MAISFEELEPDTPITLVVSNDVNKMKIPGSIKKILKENYALININVNTDNKILNFKDVRIDVECSPMDTVPFIWRGCTVTYYRNEYVLFAPGEGIKYNRRDAFRVGISKAARLYIPGHGDITVVLRDASLSGFSITDRKNELNFAIGDQASVYLEDMGIGLLFVGKVVRIEARDDKVIYGFEICKLCKGLSSYLNLKQQSNRKRAAELKKRMS